MRILSSGAAAHCHQKKNVSKRPCSQKPRAAEWPRFAFISSAISAGHCEASVGVGIVLADDLNGVIKKVDGNKITFQEMTKAKKGVKSEKVGEEKTRLMYLQERKEATYENLRDLSFEYKAGKLSDQDYAGQRAALEDEAAAILAEMESIEKARAVLRRGTRPAGVRPNGGHA